MVDSEASEILLRVPARAPYARLVRVGAAAVALREGMSFGEIDDLRLAIDEAMIVLVDGLDDSGADGDHTEADPDINVVFRVADGRFELEASRGQDNADNKDNEDKRAGEVGDISEAAVHRFDAIASGLVDDYDIDPSRGWVRLRKTPTDRED